MNIETFNKLFAMVPEGIIIPWTDGEKEHYALFRKQIFIEEIKKDIKSQFLNTVTFYNNRSLLLDPIAVYKGTERTFREVAEPDFEIGDEGIASVPDLRKSIKLNPQTATCTRLELPVDGFVFVVWMLPCSKNVDLMNQWRDRFKLSQRPDSKIWLYEWAESDTKSPHLPSRAAIRYKTELFNRRAK
tara:strand:- start:1209 stop:1769 length:561 start_codon:yes stop_codon:yes gene_type:complete